MESFRAATLNIWQKFGPWEERMPRLCKALTHDPPDVIGLQEVRCEPGFDQLAIVGNALGYHAVYGATFDDGHGRTGNGILSRYPVLDSETIALPEGRQHEWRCLVYALLDTPFGRLPFFTTHLNWRLDDGGSRRLQVQAIAEAVRVRSSEEHFPALLVGDFNAEPDSDEMRYLRGLTSIDNTYVYYADAWVFAGQGPGVTYSKHNPFGEHHREAERRIDYVFVRAPEQGRGEPVATRLAYHEPVDGMYPTDHFGVVATIRAR
jgi:endonuclease/exonuclease/phosphatase family metal-dependent hydrolase